MSLLAAKRQTMKFPSTRVVYCFLCYHVNWSYGGSIIVYHSLVYDFKVGPINIYVLATPMGPGSLMVQ